MKKRKEALTKLREMSKQELQEQLFQLGAARFQIRTQAKFGQSVPTHHSRLLRKEISRIKTILAQKALEEKALKEKAN